MWVGEWKTVSWVRQWKFVGRRLEGSPLRVCTHEKKVGENIDIKRNVGCVKDKKEGSNTSDSK